MNLWETLKKPFLSKETTKNPSSNPSPKVVEYDNLDSKNPLGFFDSYMDDYNDIFGYYNNFLSVDKAIEIQKNWILNYRRISKIPEVAQAISEIVDEATFCYSPEMFSFEIKTDTNENIKNTIHDNFNQILNLLNLKKNIYVLFEKFYIDGQLVLHITYDKNDLKKGIQKIKVLNPIFLYYDKKRNKFKYSNKQTDLTFFNFGYERDEYGDLEFDLEEIVRIDSGIYENNIILSDLHPAVKVANNLQTLEEMLVPLRFSRSVARRVFNVDVANLNSKKAEEYLTQIQNKFKYKKFYDLESGQISNQQHICALTEDYWFPNRSGAKGTTVETIDETGNLGETGDLDYFRKKLYAALKVPLARLGIDDKAEFDFTATNIARDELKFFNFIKRKRNQFADIFFQLLKRQLVAKNVLNEKQFNEIYETFDFIWLSENKFFERMRDERLTQSVTIFRDMEELAQKGWLSKEFMYKKILKLSEEEIVEIQNQIKSEKTNKLYKDLILGEIPEPMENEDFDGDTKQDSNDDEEEDNKEEDEGDDNENDEE